MVAKGIAEVGILPLGRLLSASTGSERLLSAPACPERLFSAPACPEGAEAAPRSNLPSPRRQCFSPRSAKASPRLCPKDDLAPLEECLKAAQASLAAALTELRERQSLLQEREGALQREQWRLAELEESQEQRLEAKSLLQEEKMAAAEAALAAREALLQQKQLQLAEDEHAAQQRLAARSQLEEERVAKLQFALDESQSLLNHRRRQLRSEEEEAMERLRARAKLEEEQLAARREAIAEDEASLRRRAQWLPAGQQQGGEVQGDEEDKDIVGLSFFGGETVVRVKRDLLLRFKGSKLAQLFGDGSGAGCFRDGGGNYVLDYPADLLWTLLKLLRLQSESKQPLPLPDLSVKDKSVWNDMVEALRLPLEIPRYPRFFQGIQHDISLNELLTLGWTQVLCEPYSHNSSRKDFDLAPAFVAGSLLLAAKRRDSDLLTLAAIGNYSVVTSQTQGNATVEHNGLFWYNNPDKSMGFSPTAGVNLGYPDVHAKDCPKRLSWSLKNSYGGWRAGSSCFLNDSTDWQKIILASPMQVPAHGVL